MDVEQGDATVIITPANRAVVIDTGRSDNSATRILSLLQRLGISRIEYLISTHYDRDHIAGADYLINNIASIGAVYDRGNPSSQLQDYDNYISALNSKGIRRNTISAYPPDELKLDGVTFKCLCVNGNLLNNSIINAPDENEKCIGILITYLGFDFLILGDLLTTIEDPVGEMFHNGDIQSHVDVHHVSHHGSNTSSSLNFLNNIQPESAIISVGQNTYGHPRQITIDNLRDADVDRIYLTNQGAYNNSSNDNDMVVANNNICIRTNGSQYWIGPQGGSEEHWMTDDAPPSYSISGCVNFLAFINSSGRLVRYGINSVQIDLYSGNPEQLLASTRTDQNGYYRFYNITGGGSYTIKANRTSRWRFIPPTRQISTLTSDVENQNFMALISYNYYINIPR